MSRVKSGAFSAARATDTPPSADISQDKNTSQAAIQIGPRSGLGAAESRKGWPIKMLTWDGRQMENSHTT
jgi:hypothetical protein